MANVLYGPADAGFVPSSVSVRDLTGAVAQTYDAAGAAAPPVIDGQGRVSFYAPHGTYRLLLKQSSYTDVTTLTVTLQDPIPAPAGGSTDVPVQAAVFFGAVPPGGVTALVQGSAITIPFDPANAGNYVSDPAPCHMGADHVLTFDQTGTYCITVNGCVSNATNRPIIVIYNVGTGDYIARNGFEQVTNDQIWVYTRTLRVKEGDTFTVSVAPSYVAGDAGALVELVPGLCYINIDRVGN